MKDNCILCEAELKCLYHTQDHEESGFHYRCENGHGWYIADLQAITGMRLAGKSDEEIREVIKAEDESKR